MSKKERTAILTDKEKACLKKACTIPILKRCSCGREYRCTGVCPFQTSGSTYSAVKQYCFCKVCLLREIGMGGEYVKERLKCFLD